VRTIIHSKTEGVFLKSAFDLFFFSCVPTIYEKATTFTDELDAKDFIQRCGAVEFPTDLEFLTVDTDANYATMDECIAAGVKPWDVRHVAPFKLDPRAAIRGHVICAGATRTGMSLMPHMQQLLQDHGGRVFLFDKGESSEALLSKIIEQEPDQLKRLMCIGRKRSVGPVAQPTADPYYRQFDKRR
jgi:hypothetical protein